MQYFFATESLQSEFRIRNNTANVYLLNSLLVGLKDFWRLYHFTKSKLIIIIINSSPRIQYLIFQVEKKSSPVSFFCGKVSQ